MLLRQTEMVSVLVFTVTSAVCGKDLRISSSHTLQENRNTFLSLYFEIFNTIVPV